MQSDSSAIDAKQYIDRAVQTDIPTSAPRPVSPEHSTPVGLQATSDRLSDMDISASSILSVSLSQSSSSIVADSSAYSREDSSILSTSPPPTIKTTTRTFRKVDTNNRRSARIVSLPETMSAYSAKKTLQKTPRIVSNPERFKANLVSPISSSYSEREQQPLDAFENERPGRVRVRSTATDMLHTPSPPSSPDSVEIIANNSRLPEGFLRGSNHVEESPSSTQHDDDGWISWTRSPPRPIPALHGPLSLPYARCPSGAEGTIIEEQEDLPRMIWGLEGDEASHRLRSEPVNAAIQAQMHPSLQAPSNNLNNLTSTSVSPLPHKTFTRHQFSVPPRFNNQRLQEEAARTYPLTQVQQENRGHPQPAAPPRHMAKPELLHYEYSVPEHGPIDLTNVLRPRSEGNRKYLQDPDLSTKLAYGSLGSDYHSSPDQVDLGWQSLLLTQERLKNLTLASNALSADSLGGFVNPSLSSTSLSSLSSSRSPIILDPPSHASQMSWPAVSQHAQMPPSQNTPRRMSALEIAHSYRQQQLMQGCHKQQALLPTPPNSSSPLWSSGFSPYQESLLSPELLAAARLPGAIASKNSSIAQRQQNLRHQAEMQQQSRLPEYGRLNDTGFIIRKQVDQAYLRPVAHVRETAQYRNAAHSSNNVDLSLIAATSRLRHNQARASGQNVGPLRSPAPPPKPPPNTPSTVTFRETRHVQSQTKAPVVVTPLSPTSPKSQPNMPQQHPRSIPLSRLIQRRLSSVPEEDSAILSDHAPSPTESLAEPYARRYPSEARDIFVAQKPTAPAADHMLNPQNLSFRPDIRAVEGISLPSNAATAPAPSMKPSHGRDAKMMKDAALPRNDSRDMKGTRGASRFRGRGGRGKRGRLPMGNVVNGPERANGSMTVHS